MLIVAGVISTCQLKCSRLCILAHLSLLELPQRLHLVFLLS